MTDPIREKIAALLRRTVDAGCTESEAMAAAAKAAELMREHGLSERDITVGEASVRHGSKGRSARDPLWNSLAFCTNTVLTYWHETGHAGATMVFVGRDPGPEIAAYLVAVLNHAIDTEIATFKAGPFYRRRRSDATRRAAVRDFTTGLVNRLSKRLVELFKSSIDRQASAVAQAARDERFPGSRSVKAPQSKPRFDNATLSGWSAGGRVHLGHGLTGAGGGAPKALPGRHAASNIGE